MGYLGGTEPRQTPGKARREKKKEKTAKKTAIRVVVLPIFWEERTEEMQVRIEAFQFVLTASNALHLI